MNVVHTRVRSLRTTFLLTALQRIQTVVEISISFSVANAVVPYVHREMRSFPWDDGLMVTRFVSGAFGVYLLWCAYVWGVQQLECNLEDAELAADTGRARMTCNTRSGGERCTRVRV
eukprot:gene233-411_t